MAVLAAKIEADALSMRKDVYQQVNNTGAAATFAKLLGGRKKLQDSLAPDDQRTALLCTQDDVDLVDALKGLFHDHASITRSTRKATWATAGFDFMESTHLGTQTRGSANGSYVVTTTVTTQGQATVDVQTGTGTIKQGEIFTIAAVYRVHPETKVSPAFCTSSWSTADSAGGSVTLAVSPAMYTTGALQNIDAFPQSAAAAVHRRDRLDQLRPVAALPSRRLHLRHRRPGAAEEPALRGSRTVRRDLDPRLAGSGYRQRQVPGPVRRALRLQDPAAAARRPPGQPGRLSCRGRGFGPALPLAPVTRPAEKRPTSSKGTVR
jgi:hypothetical protein